MSDKELNPKKISDNTCSVCTHRAVCRHFDDALKAQQGILDSAWPDVFDEKMFGLAQFLAQDCNEFEEQDGEGRYPKGMYRSGCILLSDT